MGHRTRLESRLGFPCGPTSFSASHRRSRKTRIGCLEELDHLAILIKPKDLIPAPVSAMHDDVRQNCLTAKNTTGSPSLLRQIHA